MTLRTLHALYAENDGGHYFDPDTLRFFGTRQAKAVQFDSDRWLYTEHQTNAPTPLIAWRASLFNADGTGPTATACGYDRSDAIRHLKEALS